MAIAIALTGFNDLGRSVTPIFFLWIIFSTDFLLLAKQKNNKNNKKLKVKKKEQLSTSRFIFFDKMHHQIPFFLALRLFVRRFQMSLKGLSFVKTLVTFGIISASDPLLMT